MKESNLWDWLREVVLPLGHYSRIESPDTAPGHPDVSFQVKGGCGTLELKANHRPAKVPFPDAEKGLHTSQRVWIRENMSHGGVVWIIAEVPGVIYIIHGKDADHFNGATHEDLIEMAWNTMSRDDPQAAFQLLDGALGTPSNFQLFGDFYA
jgi:hypothetical protein